MKQNVLRGLLVVALALGLSACGFHLVGSRPLPPELAKVQVDLVSPYTVSEPPVQTELRDSLQRRGAELTKRPGDDVTEILLSNLKEDREVLSVGSNGEALEYLLIVQVSFEVRRGDKVLMPPSTLSTSRSFSFSADEVLAKESEEARLRRYMQTELAHLLVLKLDARFSQGKG